LQVGLFLGVPLRKNSGSGFPLQVLAKFHCVPRFGTLAITFRFIVKICKFPFE